MTFDTDDTCSGTWSFALTMERVNRSLFATSLHTTHCVCRHAARPAKCDRTPPRGRRSSKPPPTIDLVELAFHKLHRSTARGFRCL